LGGERGDLQCADRAVLSDEPGRGFVCLEFEAFSAAGGAGRRKGPAAEWVTQFGGSWCLAESWMSIRFGPRGQGGRSFGCVGLVGRVCFPC
jgi:hypothetical protein